MNIIIERIKLQNFKGIGSLSVEFGDETSIWGSNATGKTTVFDGFLWALFGKDSLNQSVFDIKGLDADGNPAHNLEHSVEVALLVDGVPYLIKKTLSEKWTKKRGSAAKEFQGHTTDYAINGVPLKEKEFQDRIKGLIDERVFRLLTDPRYFNEVLGWKDRREVLLKVCGDVSAEDVISSDKSLAGLTGILNGNGIEDAKKIIASKKKEINEALEKIPVRIDEANLCLAQVRGDIGLVPGMIASREEIKGHLEAKLTDARNGGALSQKRIDLQNAISEIREAANAFERDKMVLIGPINKDLTAVQTKIDELTRQRGRLALEIEGSAGRISGMEKELEDLRKEWATIDAQEYAGACQCPTCGQDLPEIQVQAAVEKFNLDKAERLGKINARGAEKKAKLEGYREQVQKAEKDRDAICDELSTLQARENELKKQIAEIRAQQPDLTILEAKKAGIQAEIDALTQGASANTQEIEAQLATVKAEIRDLTADLQKAEANKATTKRIAELTEQEKQLAAEYEKVEGELFMIESFIRAKVNLLESKINSKFRLARFKMFKDQINGGLEEVCETTFQGVPYSSMNNAARIQVGLDIIRTLQEFYGITAPVWIDNRESVVEIPEMAGQVISLIVSEQDKQLRVETRELKKVA